MPKFIHTRGDVQGTLAFDIPTKGYLTTVLSSYSNQMFINAGATKLHPKDEFVKSIGREKATANMSMQVATLTNIIIEGGRHIYHFNMTSTHKSFESYSFVFSTSVQSDVVRVLSGGLHAKN